MGLARGFVRCDTAVVREEKSVTSSRVSPWVSGDSLGALVPASLVVLRCHQALIAVLTLPFHF